MFCKIFAHSLLPISNQDITTQQCWPACNPSWQRVHNPYVPIKQAHLYWSHFATRSISASQTPLLKNIYQAFNQLSHGIKSDSERVCNACFTSEYTKHITNHCPQIMNLSFEHYLPWFHTLYTWCGLLMRFIAVVPNW